MGLNDPEVRKGLRSIIMAVAVLVLLYFVWVWAARLDPQALREVVRGAMILLGISFAGYQMENGIRAFNLSVGKDGAKASLSADPVAQALDQAGEALKDKAAEQ